MVLCLGKYKKDTHLLPKLQTGIFHSLYNTQSMQTYSLLTNEGFIIMY